jgi:hypothetical protein
MRAVDLTSRTVIRVVILYPEVYDLARFRAGRREFPPFGPLYLAAVAERAATNPRHEPIRLSCSRRYD